jgi:nitrogenase molybdenum-iron protein NifN
MIAPVDNPHKTPFVATRNACKLCTPLGACLALAGVEGARTVLHGSQGCATYIRRYMISHFKEPIDIASSNFSESSAIFGGAANLRTALENVSRQYHPQLLGVATTCLAETIGEDVGMTLHEIRQQPGEGSEPLPPVVSVSTPSFAGTHAEGYQATLRAVVEQLAGDGEPRQELNVFSPMISPADQRYLKEIVADFGLASMLLPDYSETLDGPTWEQYQSIPDGGTTLDEIRASGSAKHSVEFSCTADASRMPAAFLKDRFGVRAHHLPMPIGIGATDALFDTLVECSGRPVPGMHQRERGRLVDALVDGHKAVFNRRAAVFGEEDLVVGIVSLLLEVGIVPVLCASGADSGRMARVLRAMTPELGSRVEVMQDTDFADLEARVEAVRPDILIGNSKGYSMSRRLGIPLVRVGFPIHDRIGGARLLHVGYRGAQQLFDRITNTLIEQTQSASNVGYTYM